MITGTTLGASEPPYDAPKISGLDQNGQDVDLSKAFAEGWTVVYFYPKADTPGCTKQGCSLRDSWTQLQAKGVKVFGVSGDKPDKQKAFQEKFHFPFPLIADEDGKVMDAFGVPHVGGIAKRQAFLVKDGKVVWKDGTASTTEQGQDILNAIAELEKK